MTSKDHEEPPLAVVEKDRLPQQADSVLDTEWVAKRLGPLADAAQIRLLLFLTAPHKVEEICSEFSITDAQAMERLQPLLEAGLVARMDDVGSEYVIDLRILFALFEELEKMGGVRPEEHDDPLSRTMAVPVRGARAPTDLGAVLAIVRGFGWGRRHALGRGDGRVWTLGREGFCDIPLEYDPYASKKHAEVRFKGDGFVLRDLDSTNGTNHNLQMLPPGGEARLAHGDLIGVGKSLILFWDRPMVR